MIGKAKIKKKSDKVPYGYYGHLVSNIAHEHSWITINILKKAFRKFEETKEKEVPDFVEEAKAKDVPESIGGVHTSTSELSDLTKGGSTS